MIAAAVILILFVYVVLKATKIKQHYADEKLCVNCGVFYSGPGAIGGDEEFRLTCSPACAMAMYERKWKFKDQQEFVRDQRGNK
jgi:hypothetical protein